MEQAKLKRKVDAMINNRKDQFDEIINDKYIMQVKELEGRLGEEKVARDELCVKITRLETECSRLQDAVAVKETAMGAMEEEMQGRITELEEKGGVSESPEEHHRRRQVRLKKRQNFGSLYIKQGMAEVEVQTDPIDFASISDVNGEGEGDEEKEKQNGGSDGLGLMGKYKDRATQFTPLLRHVGCQTRTAEEHNKDHSNLNPEQERAQSMLRKVREDLRAKVDKHQHAVNRKRHSARRMVGDALDDGRDLYGRNSEDPALAGEMERLDWICCQLEVQMCRHRLDETMLADIEGNCTTLADTMRKKDLRSAAVSLGGMAASVKRTLQYINDLAPLEARLREAADSAGLAIDEATGDVSDEMPGLPSVIAQLKALLDIEGLALEAKFVFKLQSEIGGPMPPVSCLWFLKAILAKHARFPLFSPCFAVQDSQNRPVCVAETSHMVCHTFQVSTGWESRRRS